ncbi:trypsin 5G1-like [Leptopilina boulardi]|uniref:trypsin 5G1-like n=1 Tax=Leptopilina boulardi TaxID=63433 RepID=UPI0021F64D4E|nr:trypsin 5G1-like [Leptopilina boulardi]
MNKKTLFYKCFLFFFLKKMFKIIFLLLCGFLLVISHKSSSLKISSIRTSKIINGHLTTIEKFPFLVSLQYNGTFFNHSVVHFCCGNIISEYWILTAAQCMKARNINNFHIRGGSTKYFKDGEVYKPAEIIIHPKFIDAQIGYDIALIKLSTGVLFNDRIKPIKLPTADMIIKDNTLLDIAGWGKFDEIHLLSNSLRETQVAKINNRVCEYVYGNGSIKEDTFCVYKNGYGPCVGDTGSPAKLNDILFGMASWSYSCGYNYPTAYTNLLSYITWIKNVTGIV